MPITEMPALLARASEDAPTIELMNIRIRVLAAADETNGAFSLLEYTAPPRFAGPPPHCHALTTEWFYVLDGVLVVEQDGAQQALGAGSLLVVPPGVPHSFSNPADEPCRFLLHVSPGGMDEYFRELAEMIRDTPSWALADPACIAELGARFDSHPHPAPGR
ncbi:MAG TPA: cupin domain-containing protein [Longimicrobium sp.]|jgi:quercetin dioxygenase-like cupin family protein|uniref:cupin domain-containing protein n=1 Tax=Longimicrobium sp. TaxID=2029185 RepID=UPI002EDB0AD0